MVEANRRPLRLVNTVLATKLRSLVRHRQREPEISLVERAWYHKAVGRTTNTNGPERKQGTNSAMTVAIRHLSAIDFITAYVVPHQ